MASGCTSFCLALGWGARGWQNAVWCRAPAGMAARLVSCRILGSQGGLLAFTPFGNSLRLAKGPARYHTPASQDHVACLSSDLESSCAVVWLLPLSGKTSPGFLMGYNALPFLACGSPLVWILFGPMHWLPLCPLWQTPWRFLPSLGSVPLQGDLESRRREE